jgi:ADP-dependent phosphofructokinase/glucokinase
MVFKLYDVIKSAFFNIDKSKDIFCSYNGCIDLILPIRESTFISFQQRKKYFPHKFSDALYISELSTLKDLINFVIYFLHLSSGGEGDIINSNLVQEVTDTLSYSSSIGGTGAQAANLLAQLDFQNVHLHLPIYTSNFREILHPLIKVYENNQFYKDLFGDSIFELFSEVHCIFDYAIGTAYKIGKMIKYTKKPDRIILSFDKCNSFLSISRLFQKELWSNHRSSSFLVSGFSAIRDFNHLKKFIFDNNNTIKSYRVSHSNNCSVHLEEGDYWDREIERRRLLFSEVYPLVDSIGMNEREFQRIVTICGIEEKNPVKALYKLACYFGLKRINLHTDKTCISVSSYPKEQEILMLGFGILLASVKAYYGKFVEIKRVEEFLEIIKEIAFQKNIEKCYVIGCGYRVFCMPTLYGINIISSLGLGDAFTAGVMAYL